jgi:predicted transposase YbfD/YdcC
MEAELKIDLSLLSHFSVIRDPRRVNRKLHHLDKILVVSICGILSGAESWVEVEEFGKANQEWLARLIDLENGIPSHDTFGRVFGLLDPDGLQSCFSRWVETLRQHVDREIVAIDGKTLRRSFDKANGELPFHIVSAWANENELSLGQVAVDEKSNEIKAIPELLKVLALEGCIVTIDAMGCQKEITEKIREKKADYVLTLKRNHKNLNDRAEMFFQEHGKTNFRDLDHEFYETTEKNHGRDENRKYYLTTLTNCLQPMNGWKDLNSIGMVIATRTVDGQTSSYTRYFISSLRKNSISDFSRAVRCHWGIENKLHWTLDVCFREDLCRVRKDYAAINFALLRKICLNLVKLEKSTKKSFRVKKFKATFSRDYLLFVLLNKNTKDCG